MKLMILLSLFFSMTVNAITYEDFHKLSEDEKIDHLSLLSADVVYSLDDSQIKQQHFSPEVFSSLEGRLKEIFQGLKTYTPDFDTEVHYNDFYALVGGVQEEAELFFSEDHKFIGGTIFYWQRGCSPEDSYADEFETYYENYEEANADSCFDNDVSWSGSTTFDENFNELTNSDFMEWSGH